MLFDSSLRKELARSFGATLVVLVTVVMTMVLIRTLGQATRGSVNPADVTLVMGFSVLGYLPTILSLSLFITVVAVLSRMYRDSEMVIWFASGQGLARLLPPLLRFAWPVIAVVAVLALGVWPWANTQIQELKVRYEQRGDVDRVAPGEFQESASGNRVFFIEKDPEGKQRGNNVLVVDQKGTSESITSARSARLQTMGPDRFALLSHGQRLESAQDQPTLRVSEFVEYGIRIGAAPPNPIDNPDVNTLPTQRLIAQPTPLNLGELGWRVGQMLAAFNLVVLGLALASVNPRAGRSSSLVLALLAFIVYLNCMTLGQTWVAAGRVRFVPFMLLLHAGMLALGALVLTARHNGWSWRTWWSRRHA